MTAASKETAVVVLGEVAMGAAAWVEVAMVRVAAKEMAVVLGAAAAVAAAGVARVAAMGGSEGTSPWTWRPLPHFPSQSPPRRSQTPCLPMRRQ